MHRTLGSTCLVICRQLTTNDVIHWAWCQDNRAWFPAIRSAFFSSRLNGNVSALLNYRKIISVSCPLVTHSVMAEEEKDYFILPKSAATGSRDALDRQLENALMHGYSVIVVEPRGLGDEIIRWIRFGNFLHKSAVVANLGCLVLLPFLSRRSTNLAVIPLSIYGTTCALFYNFSWSCDPCCKYQVDHHGKELKHISSYQLSSRSPVVLVRRNPNPRLVLHTALAMLVCGYLGWRLGELLFRQ